MQCILGTDLSSGDYSWMLQRQVFKAVLLHNGNKLPSIPVTYAPSTKGTYTTTRNTQVEVDYKKYQWEFCGYFKVIAVLLGLQAGYTKYTCFLCE